MQQFLIGTRFLIVFLFLSFSVVTASADDSKDYINFENIQIERPLTEAKIKSALDQYTTQGKTLSSSQILKLSDLRRGPDKAFSMNNNLIAYKNDKVVSEQKLKVYFRGTEKENEVYKSLVKILSPARSRGNLLLNNGDKVWFYSPSSRRPIRISKQQRLMGQISNGDVLSVNFRLDYQITGQTTVTLDGVEYYFLNLKANDRSVTYDKIDYWIQKGTFYPFKARFYAISGRPLKTAYYKDYKTILNVIRCGKVVIYDEINKKAFSEILYADMQFSDIPEKHFQKNYLKFIK